MPASQEEKRARATIMMNMTVCLTTPIWMPSYNYFGLLSIWEIISIKFRRAEVDTPVSTHETKTK